MLGKEQTSALLLKPRGQCGTFLSLVFFAMCVLNSVSYYLSNRSKKVIVSKSMLQSFICLTSVNLYLVHMLLVNYSFSFCSARSMCSDRTEFNYENKQQNGTGNVVSLVSNNTYEVFLFFISVVSTFRILMFV